PIIGLAAAENQERAVVAVVVLFLWLVLAALARRRWIACHSVDVSRLLLTLSVMTGLHVGRSSGGVVGVFLAAAVGAALNTPTTAPLIRPTCSPVITDRVSSSRLTS